MKQFGGVLTAIHIFVFFILVTLFPLIYSIFLLFFLT